MSYYFSTQDLCERYGIKAVGNGVFVASLALLEAWDVLGISPGELSDLVEYLRKENSDIDGKAA